MSDKIDMKISIGYPPNIDKIREVLDVSNKNICFTYGDTIYNPSGNPISEHLMVHESTHKMQQGDNPDVWWKQYLEDPKFRLQQEVEAYKKQYRYLSTQVNDRNLLFKALYGFGTHLAGAMYGNMVSVTEAMEMIKMP